MNNVRKQKMMTISLIGLVIATAVAFILYALSKNINLFYTPSQVVNGEAPRNQKIRLGGMVVKGSVERNAKDLHVRFTLTDFKQKVVVSYNGILPDLFREGQGIVTQGSINEQQQFIASSVLAKHDANYMPPEVKKALGESHDS